jgi:hypothetical protein
MCAAHYKLNKKYQVLIPAAAKRMVQIMQKYFQ